MKWEAPKSTSFLFLRKDDNCLWEEHLCFSSSFEHPLVSWTLFLFEGMTDRLCFFRLGWSANIFSKMIQVNLLLQGVFLTNDKIPAFTRKLKLCKTYICHGVLDSLEHKVFSIIQCKFYLSQLLRAMVLLIISDNVEHAVHTHRLVTCELWDVGTILSPLFLYSVTKVWS